MPNKILIASSLQLNIFSDKVFTTKKIIGFFHIF